MFKLSPKQSENLNDWQIKHQEKCRCQGGAIGGKVSYKFTPTSIGDIIVVSCSVCKDEIDLSDYEDW